MITKVIAVEKILEQTLLYDFLAMQHLIRASFMVNCLQSINRKYTRM